MDDSIRRMLEEQERLVKLADPYYEIEKTLGQTAADILRAAQGITPSQASALTVQEHIEREMRTVADMIADIGGYDCAASSIAKDISLGESTRLIAEQLSIVSQTYELPTQTRFQELFEIVNGSTASTLLAHYHDEASAVKKAMEAIQLPWVNLENDLQSVLGFSSLHGIGSILASNDLFSDRVADILRQDLGDWREEIEWPESIFSNALARNAFYIEQGFNPSLVQFPADVFPEVLHHSGIKPVPIEEFDFQQEEPAQGEADDLYGVDFHRTNKAQGKILYFERKFRQFIIAKMTAHHGEQWLKHQVSGQIRQNWKKRQEKARDEGRPVQPEIHYADFADYMNLIVQKNNWEPIFKVYFRRQTSVTESFQRIIPIRNDAMHSRFITQTDELYLDSEITRFLETID